VQDSFPIFREGVTAANRQTFAESLVSVIKPVYSGWRGLRLGAP
jgi:hypothetical protein